MLKNKILNRYISERTAQDIFDLQELIESKEQSPSFNIFVSAVTVSQSLKSAYNKFNVLKKLFTYFSYHKSHKWVMRKFSLMQINDICEEILKLEGVDVEDVKKKLIQQDSPEVQAKG